MRVASRAVPAVFLFLLFCLLAPVVVSGAAMDPRGTAKNQGFAVLGMAALHVADAIPEWARRARRSCRCVCRC
eukprot:gene4490-189_t